MERNCDLRDISEGQVGGEGDEIHFGCGGVRSLQGESWEIAREMSLSWVQV